MIELRKMLALVLDKKAGELLLKGGQPPAILLRGMTRPLNLPSLEPHETDLYLKAILPDALLPGLEAGGSVVFDHPFENKATFRVIVRRDAEGWSLSFHPPRLLPAQD